MNYVQHYAELARQHGRTVNSVRSALDNALGYAADALLYHDQPETQRSHIAKCGVFLASVAMVLDMTGQIETVNYGRVSVIETISVTTYALVSRIASFQFDRLSDRNTTRLHDVLAAWQALAELVCTEEQGDAIGLLAMELRRQQQEREQARRLEGMES